MQGLSGHAARAIEHQHDIGGAGQNIGFRSQRQRDQQRAGAVDLVGIDGFICECNAHACLLLAFDMVILCEKRQQGHKKVRDDL